MLPAKSQQRANMMHKEITQTMLHLMLRYEECTGKMYWLNPPQYHPDLVGKEAGAPRLCMETKLYQKIKVLGKTYSRSRLAFLYVHGHLPPYIDHINGNSLDDRICNLREATMMQNSWNRTSRKKASTLPMGIRVRKSGLYEARIMCNKKSENLGVFKNIDDAVAAYVAARKAKFGEYSGL